MIRFLQSKQEKFESELIYHYVIPIGVAIITLFILYRVFKIIEYVYLSYYEKPFCNHCYLNKRRLTRQQVLILQNEYDFYRKLSSRHKRYFEHRVAKYINEIEFVGHEGLIVTDQMKVLIASTAVMLTFGFKNYNIARVKTIILYPTSYYSQINESYHKGEYNHKLQVIVFSWKDFKEGYQIGDDNLNLGIHEFGHAIHLNASTKSEINSLMFNKGFQKLISYLESNEQVRKQLITSKYFRAYAYTNHYEFFAVILENFIETPDAFRTQFPELYKYVKQMLNFKLEGY